MHADVPAFVTISVRTTDGARAVFPLARFLGVRDGHLFLEDGIPVDPTRKGLKTYPIHSFALTELAGVDIETGEDGDRDSETSLALESSGLVDLDGNVLPR